MSYIKLTLARLEKQQKLDLLQDRPIGKVPLNVEAPTPETVDA